MAEMVQPVKRKPLPFNEYTFVNLNRHSTHPNPWRPPSEYEKLLPSVYDGMFITKNAHWEIRKPAALEEDPVVESMAFWGWQGFKLGAYLGFIDTYLVKQSNCWRTILSRMAFKAPIYASMPISYVGFRHFLGGLGENKNAVWTYPAAAIASGSIYGAYAGKWRSGAGHIFWFGLFAFAYKVAHEVRFFDKVVADVLNKANSTDFSLYPDNDPDLGTAQMMSEWPNHWKAQGKMFFDTPVEPGWKRWLDPKDRDKGPEV